MKIPQSLAVQILGVHQVKLTTPMEMDEVATIVITQSVQAT